MSRCPTWLHPSGNGKCVDHFQTVVVCMNEVGVFNLYCLTSNGDVSTFLEALSYLLNQIRLYNKVLRNRSEQEE